MATSNFQLQPAIDNFIERLNSKGGFTSDDLNELKSHLADSVLDLQLKGFTQEESFLVASCRIGNENELSTEYQKVNGTNYKQSPTFYIITGMLFFFLLIIMWKLFASLSKFISLKFESSETESFLIGLFFSLAIVGIYYVVLNSAKSIISLEKKLHKNSVNFSTIYLFVVLLLSILFIYLIDILNTNNSALRIGHKSNYTYHDSEINFWVVPAGFLLISLFFLFKSENEKFRIGKIINKGGLIFFISIGILWESIASFTRFLTKGIDLMSGAIIYAFIFSVAVFVLARHLTDKPFQKVVAFSAFAFILELLGGFLNPMLTMGAFLSVFFYFLLVGIAFGYVAGRIVYKKYNMIAGQIHL